MSDIASGLASRAISLAYSVDADDAFMFHALRAGAIDAAGLTFSHRRDHTAALNRLALEGAADVVAVSLGVYPAIADRYQLLPHGASVGRGYGPVVVARRPLGPEGLAGLRVGIPGATTTAWLVLRLLAPGAVGVEIPISPFNRIFEALAAGEVDAALLIHEGRLLYPARGLHLVADLGVFWQEKTGLPLPLGVNVIRRALGPAEVARVSGVLRASIAWALAHRREMIALIAAEDRGDKALSDQALIDHYLNLYANADTAAIADDARRAVEVLFTEARRAGLISAETAIEWAP
ncbi:MAG TPA: MqnA/MqnD/SBP family protein [Polyangia bacterium]|nr:MqnA/MqnD/SBP family protein [Polyangia bacterium]